jgi:rhamnulose-1-phosphate aldolase/alcohol dehydrogenase
MSISSRRITVLSQWVEKDAHGKDSLALLVYQSRLIGTETELVVWGGGNTSLKLIEKDFRGTDTHVMRIKGSGSDLKSIEERHFPAIRLEDITPLLLREEMSDEEMIEYLEMCLMDPHSFRPSIETLLHAFLPHASIVHSHADAIVSLTNTTRPLELLRQVYGDAVAPVGYRRPGFLLAKEVAQVVSEQDRLRGIVLLNHGLVTWGTTPLESYDAHIQLVTKAEEFVQSQRIGTHVLGEITTAAIEPKNRLAIASSIGPTLRGLISNRVRSLLKYDDSQEAVHFAGSSQAKELSELGPATPDHLVQTKRKPLWVHLDTLEDTPNLLVKLRKAVEEYSTDYMNWYNQYATRSEPVLDPYPRVILIPGLGMWTTGSDAQAALIANEIYHHTISVISKAEVSDSYRSITPKDAFDVEYWPLELYKLTLKGPDQLLSRRIALVTGAAHGIGLSIAQRLVAEGAHVVLTDVDYEAVKSAALQLCETYGYSRALGLQMDVTNIIEVENAFRELRLRYGGLDILVSNAGVAHVGAIDSLSLIEWQRSLDVNATGHFLVAQQTIRLMKEQGIGGSLVFVATKNVTAPGGEFGAYSASKAAEVQLARVLAIENGEYGIRCNVVNPDAVFQGTGLWSREIREHRAKAHGIGIDEIEEFYRQRNLLKVTVTPADVAETVLFLASERSSKTTGAMIQVDGGVREAFPR